MAIAAGVAVGAPAWEPGTRHGYHGVTFGWLVGELVRRISGSSLGTFFDDRGGAAARHRRVHLHRDAARRRSGRWPRSWSSPCKPGKESALRAIDPESRSGRSVLAGAHGSLFADEEGRPRFADFMNTPAVLQAEIGALGATATARALARVYAALAAGEELVSRASVERFRDRAGVRARRRHGRADTVGRRLLARAARTRARASRGCTGRTTAPSVTWAPAARSASRTRPPASACGFVRNHLENQALPLMGACLVDVLYSCTGNGRS